jgi:branched-chain amino acid transport system substrate-binding protein
MRTTLKRDKTSMKNKFISACIAIIFAGTIWASNVIEGSAQAEPLEPVRIAVLLALTGIAADDNYPAIQAAELAVEETNRKGGILGRLVELRFIDNRSTPLGSKHAAEKAVQAGIVGVIGPLWSSHAMPAAAVLQKARIPMITPTATKPEITRAGDYIFRTCMSDDFQGLVMARFAHERLGAKTAVVLKNISEEYSVALADRFINSFEEIGGRLLWEGAYKGTAVSFEDILEEVRGVDTDVLFIPGYARDSGLLVQQAVNMGIRSVFLGGDGWGESMRQYAGEALLGGYYTTHYHPDLPFVENVELKRIYKERFGLAKIDDIRIPLTYDSVMLFMEAVRRAGCPDRGAIREALASTQNFRGATGTITFDEHGDPMGKEAVILRFEKERSAFIHSITQ